jgi:hypothetical protein
MGEKESYDNPEATHWFCPFCLWAYMFNVVVNGLMDDEYFYPKNNDTALVVTF